MAAAVLGLCILAGGDTFCVVRKETGVDLKTKSMSAYLYC